MTDFEPMSRRKDGRLYSKVTRRCVALLQHVPPKEDFVFTTVAIRKTLSMRWAAVSTIRRALQEGHTPRPLQLNATKKS